MHALTNALKIINAFFANIVPIGDILWTFPQNFSWYANIPIIGSIPFAIYLLLGMGIYFSIRTKFVQFRYFKRGIQVLTKKKKDTTGVSPLAAFMLSAAMRVGPGNIIGVTGAISLGGPGAMFWMWISALLGMASSFVEATLAQIFKEKDGDEYVGGLPYYGQKLAGNKKGVGIASVTGVSTDRTSPLYYALAIILIIGIAIAVFGGIKRVTAVTDRMVPVMAVLYATVIVGLFIANIHLFPAFIQAVVIGAFKPDAIFGGAFGTVLAQGIKRGLLSNEAGQVTITMSAAISEQDHPVEQGFVQSIGVFLDTIIICTLSGFIVCGAHIWTNSAYNWEVLKDSKIDVFLSSLKEMIPGTAADGAVSLFICICYGLFAFTSLLGLVSFASIAGTRITKSKAFTNFVRALGALIFVPLGTLCVLAGLELDNIWYVSDLINIALVFANAPIILYGGKYVYRALKDYVDNDGKRFVAKNIGVESDIWKDE